MAKKENETIAIDGVTYNVADLTQEQITLVNHVADLEKKLNSLQFNLDQLRVGRDAFLQMLKQSLEASDEPEEAVG